MSQSLVIDETLKISHVYWLVSLPESEMGPTNRILEDLEPTLKNHRIKFELVYIKSKSHFICMLKSIAQNSKGGLMPLIHMDMHSNEEDGLFIDRSKENVSWDLLINLLREINVNCKNNLFVFFATCYAYHAVKSITLSKATPFCAMVAPPEEISNGFLEDKTHKFYHDGFSSDNFSSAIKTHLSSHLIYYHCQGIFLTAIVEYIQKYCRIENRKSRAKSIVRQKVDISIKNRNARRKMHAEMTKRLRPGPYIIRHFERVFLCGGSAKFNYNQVKRALRAKSHAQKS